MNDKELIRNAICEFKFDHLFREHLGWETYADRLPIEVSEKSYSLLGIAEKRGLVVLHCSLPQIPLYAERRKIEMQVARRRFEHLIVFTDDAHTKQIWQWVRREPNKPLQCREQIWEKGQTAELLIQKLEVLRVSLDEEPNASITKVKGSVAKAFSPDKVTKKFYERFQKEHTEFKKFIKGIEAEADANWYTSITLNRLMFVYFIQKKGFLANDTAYLRNRLAVVQQQRGKNEFHTFYRYFLLRLFHEGLGGQLRNPELDKLLGNVPYLNGGLFEVHELECMYPNLDIPDEAFANIFNFFDEYNWHLDDRPLHSDKEINPDVLGYIFEKFINQKQMGAYYTKEDITEYISKNTILPYLLEQSKKNCTIAFNNPGGNTVWQLLAADPDRYLYDAMRTGVIEDGTIIPESKLPEFVQQGMHDPQKRMFDKRYNLQPAGNSFVPTLPTETWREYVTRRNRCLQLRHKLQNGEITSVNDLITYNLNIRQFAQDVVERWEGTDFFRAFWQAITSVTVLDPTCGSGAFLFAALNILEPLYEACLERMKQLTGEGTNPGKFADFRNILDEVNRHPNRVYFIFKRIILNNLYGVDIMDEAVEICKLRLFLKLAAQVDPDNSKPNYGLEPLPDIDFNIRAGNTLVGYATYDDVKKAVETDLIAHMEGTLGKIEQKAKGVQQAFDSFRKAQTDGSHTEHKTQKAALRQHLTELEDELNRYLAKEYNKTPDKPAEYTAWLASHKPFNWFIEFYGIMASGGFDVIIGNPPYVEYKVVSKEYTLPQYRTLSCGNLYVYSIEQCLKILRQDSFLSMIVQLPIVCTDRMIPLQKLLFENSSTWFSSFDDRPGKLFDNLEHIRTTIFVLQKQLASSNHVYSTAYNRWYSEKRKHLFDLLRYSPDKHHVVDGAIAKSGNEAASLLIEKLHTKRKDPIKSSMVKSQYNVYFHNAPQYWVRAMETVPYFWNEREGQKQSTQIKTIPAASSDIGPLTACLNSSLFYWWFILLSDCRHLNMREIENFPLGLSSMPVDLKTKLSELSATLMADYEKHKLRKECTYKTTGKVAYDEYYPALSKPIIDQIDMVLARHYGFTNEELDFIINYDIKYRMGSKEEE